jgi:protein-L-isoaspartate(D-aspartate) O-methyltransferase
MNLGQSELFQRLRNNMVDYQIAGRGVSDSAVLDAMKTVPRHMFVPPEYQQNSYDDSPLPIGNGQTISQPYIVGFMADAARLTPTDKVLEVGTGCGYSAAIISKVVHTVHTVETVPFLAETAKVRLNVLGFTNIICHYSDGSVGLPEHAPFDAIIVTASAPKIPNSLKAQLKTGGRMIIPVHNGNGK